MTMIDGTIRFVIHIPAPGDAGAFYFGAVLTHAWGSREIPAHALPVLMPELAPYVSLHECDHTGTPPNIATNAWYHAAGVVMPDLPEADRAAPEVCTDRFAKLMRMDPEYAAFQLSKLAKLAQEFDDWVIVRNELMALIDDVRPRWQRQAEEAIVTLPTVLERMTQ